jgi:DNA primase
MTISTAFLDTLRERTSLSALIGQSIKINKAGREYKACCPFHGEKTPSFTINDEKGFWHCFGCAAHGDAIRWMTDYKSLPFPEAVRALADAAGLEVPAASAAAAARAAKIDGLRPALDAAQDYFSRQIIANRTVGFYLNDRGISREVADRFGIGFAPQQSGYLKHLGIDAETAVASGLAWQDAENTARSGERFLNRIMVPVHDARGRLISFGGREFALAARPGAPEPRASGAKYKNGAATVLFDKSRTLFNMHRALPAARAKPGSTGRLIIVEGYFDVISMAAVGIDAVVAPMGTALTVHQLQLCWRVHVSPILMFDGDKAGLQAAMRACEMALPMVGPAGTLRVAICPPGKDPDDLAREGGAERVEGVLAQTTALSDFVFSAVVQEARKAAGAASGAAISPEAVSAIWHRLEEMAQSIQDAETKAQYLGAWRARFEREVSHVAVAVPHLAIDVYARSDDGSYVFPESEEEGERRLISVVRRKLELRAQRREISQVDRDLMSLAKSIGLSPKALTAMCVALETDPETREEHEAILALYRRVLGIKGPMSEAMMPPPLPTGVSARRIQPAKSSAQALAWLDAS